MMTTAAQTLKAHNEKVIYEGRLHGIVFARSIILLSMFVVCAVLIMLIEHGAVGDYLAQVEPQTLQRLILSHTILWLIPFIFAISGMISYVHCAVKLKTSRIIITNRRVMMKIGALTTFSVEIFRDKIETVDVFQSLAGRVFDYGIIVLVGVGGSPQPFGPIANPRAFRSRIFYSDVGISEDN